MCVTRRWVESGSVSQSEGVSTQLLFGQSCYWLLQGEAANLERENIKQWLREGLRRLDPNTLDEQ